MYQGSVEAPRLLLNLAESTLWNLAEKWEDRGVGQWLGLRETDGPVMQHSESRRELETMMEEVH